MYHQWTLSCPYSLKMAFKSQFNYSCNLYLITVQIKCGSWISDQHDLALLGFIKSSNSASTLELGGM